MANKLSVIILTYNEEANIDRCLSKITNWSDDIIVIDSFSSDSTIEIAKKYTNSIFQVKQGHWAEIRNWAIESIAMKYEWIVFLDADEYLSEEALLEIETKILDQPVERGFYIKRRFFFLDKWLKFGGLYPEVLRIFKKGFVRYIKDGDVEYAEVNGPVARLENDMIHHDLKPFSAWIEKHNRISDRAVDKFLMDNGKKVTSFLSNNNYLHIEGGLRKHKLKESIWDKIPIEIRPYIMFIFSYFLKLGFLDGLEGYYYHTMQALWYRQMIAIKTKERRLNSKRIV
jgi:glycosyltransferase involved in cell wall biosynthesis